MINQPRTAFNSIHARALLDAIYALPDPDLNIAISIRQLLIDHDDLCPDIDHTMRDIIRSTIMHLDPDSLARARLDESLCPLHAIDYAICFDDDDDECALIRDIFPSHDT